MKINVLLLCGLLVFIFPLIYNQENKKIVINDDLEILPLTENSFIHISYLELSGRGRFPCNGLVFTNSDSVIVIDTPVNDTLSVQLISWLNSRDLYIKAVIPTHWHVDNIGGLKAFHKAGIQSYAYSLTKELAIKNHYESPSTIFSDSLIIPFGEKYVQCTFHGAGHTLDNIVVWIPSEKILFGGCLVKAADYQGLGNTADADLEA